MRKLLLRWLGAVEPTPPEPRRPCLVLPLSDGQIRTEWADRWGQPGVLMLTLERGEASMRVRLTTDALRSIADHFDDPAHAFNGIDR